VRLLDDVVVEHESIWLSDLLPPSAPLDVRSSAEKIFLGRAPEPGNFRIFTRRQLGALLKQADAAELPLSVSVSVTVHRRGWPISIESLQNALLNSPWSAFASSISGSNVSLPQGFTSRIRDPQLEILGITGERGPRFVLARLRCRDRSACGSFLAQLVLPEVSTSGLLHSTKARTAIRTAKSGAILIRSGSAATLVIEEDGLKIRQRVLALSSGQLGEPVRVRDPVTRRSFSAEVAGDGWLRPIRAEAKPAHEAFRDEAYP
jgi:hypothetical protein